jgi:hypothetical protein
MMAANLLILGNNIRWLDPDPEPALAGSRYNLLPARGLLPEAATAPVICFRNAGLYAFMPWGRAYYMLKIALFS